MRTRGSRTHRSWQGTPSFFFSFFQFPPSSHLVAVISTADGTQKKSNISGVITYSLEIVSVEPGGQTGHLLVESDLVGGTVVTLVVAGSDNRDEGKNNGHDHSGKLSEVHDDVCVGGLWRVAG